MLFKIEISMPLIPEHPSFRRVVATQIRLLVCDKENSLINKIYNEPMLPDFTSEYLGGSSPNELIFHNFYPMFDYEKNPIKLEEWLSRKIIYFNRDYKSIPLKFEENMYQQIVSQIKPKSNRPIFECHYITTKENLQGEEYTCRELNPNISDKTRIEIYEILNSCGYNALTIYDFIKMWGDKSASHVDRN